MVRNKRYHDSKSGINFFDMHPSKLKPLLVDGIHELAGLTEGPSGGPKIPDSSMKISEACIIKVVLLEILGLEIYYVSITWFFNLFNRVSLNQRRAEDCFISQQYSNLLVLLIVHGTL